MGRRKSGPFDPGVFLRVSIGLLLGTVVGVVLYLGVVPEAATFRPAVLSTVAIPLGCFFGWSSSSSREGAPTAALACFGLYFLSAFAAARWGTLFPEHRYFGTVLWMQALAGLVLALMLGRAGRTPPQVEELREAGDRAGLAGLLEEGGPRERREAVRALGVLGGAQARPALLEALGDPHLPVRREAAAALIGVAGAEDVPALEAALRDRDAIVRQRALEALRWIASPGAKEAMARYWRDRLASRGAIVWRQALVLLLGGGLLWLSLALPWVGLVGAGRRLWGLEGGTTVGALLVVGALLPPGEFLWGMARRNLVGHQERLRLWAFLPAAVLALALLWPLQAVTVPPAGDWTALGGGFYTALGGAILELAGAFLIRG